MSVDLDGKCLNDKLLILMNIDVLLVNSDHMCLHNCNYWHISLGVKMVLMSSYVIWS